jgi:hypothetical protein
MHELKRNDLLYPELSFKIVGCAFEVHTNWEQDLKSDLPEGSFFGFCGERACC